MQKTMFGRAVILLLGAMGTAQVVSSLQENQTWDEAFELATGYNYLKTGMFRLNVEQPPVGKLVSAVPLLLLNPSIPSLENRGELDFGHEFLYRNRVPADKLLFTGRLGTITLTLLLGLVLAQWTQRKFGTSSALFALVLFAFDPNLIAHGRYTTTDLAATAFIFFACITWIDFLETRKGWRLALAGVTLGLAMATKYSALILIPTHALLYSIRWRQRPDMFDARDFVKSFAVLAALVCLTIVLIYAPEANLYVPAATKLGLTHPGLPPLWEFVDRRSAVGEAVYWIARWLNLAPNSYCVGLYTFAGHNVTGHDSYVLGQFSTRGWWYYFPVVFLVKTPTAVLLSLALMMGMVAGARFPRMRQLPIVWPGILVPLVAFFAGCMTSHINLGVRHLLPAYPLLYVAIGAGFPRLIPAQWKRGASLGAAVICCLLIAESFWSFPNYLSFFNAVSGGSSQGPKYLLDSNVDWGQDLKKLRRYLDSRMIRSKVCLEYFGEADTTYYGFQSFGYVPKTWDKDERENVDCVAAVSASLLYGHYKGAAFSWLRAMQPMARVGGSIYIYDLRKKPVPEAR